MPHDINDECEILTQCTRAHIAWVLRYHKKKVWVTATTCVQGDTQIPRTPRSTYYDTACREALEYIWLHADRICSKRLKCVLPLWIHH